MTEINELANCSICGMKRKKLKGVTKNKGLPVFVCQNIKVGQRMPCDGNAYTYIKD